jgi:hypothetical protein
MAAPKKNEFWKLRSKHGRDKKFKSPEHLWDAACAYFEWSTNNPLIKFEYRGAREVKLQKIRPFTIGRLCLHIGCNESYFRTFKAQSPDEEEFMHVINRIELVVYAQQLEGALCGFFNAYLIARLIGIKRSHDVNVYPGLQKTRDNLFPIVNYL